jgi:hypothetical protein
MSVSMLFLLGLSITFLVSVAVVWYLSSPLRKQLLELCGNSDRAEFWTVFSNATLALVPIIFAMQFQPSPDARVPAVFFVVGQIKWGIAGLVSSMLVLAWILSRFIPRKAATPSAPSLKSKSGEL